MKSRGRFSFFIFALISCAPLFLTGCLNLKPKADPVKLYALGSSEAVLPIDPSGTVIHVSRPNLPAYLDGKRLQFRKENGEVGAVSRARWAEPLEEGLSRALAEALVAIGGNRAVSYYPWPDRSKASKELRVSIFKLGVSENGEVRMTASWELKTSAGVTRSGVFESVGVIWEVGNPESYVAALNTSLGQLAESLSSSF